MLDGDPILEKIEGTKIERVVNTPFPIVKSQGTFYLSGGGDLWSCAKIFYDLVLEIQLGNQQIKRVRKPREIRLSDGRASDVVEHVMEEGSSMIGYEAKVVRCEVCEMGVD